MTDMAELQQMITATRAARGEQAGRVHKDHLRVALHRHTANAGAGGLDLMGDNRDLCADHQVGQRGFACVRLSDECDESGARCHGLPYVDPAL